MLYALETPHLRHEQRCKRQRGRPVGSRRGPPGTNLAVFCNLMSIDFLLNNPVEEQVSYAPTEAEILKSVHLPESACGSYSKEDDSVAAPPVPLRNTASMLAELKTF